MRFVEKFNEHPGQSVIAIVEANYIGDFAIRLTFNDGHQKLVDFKPFLEQAKHPSIKKYLDEPLFKSFQIVEGNLNWNDFDLCTSIADLYTNSILKEETTSNTL